MKTAQKILLLTAIFLLVGWLFGFAGSQPEPLLALILDAPERLTHVVMLDGRTGETNESSDPADIAATLTLLQSLTVTRQADQSARAGYRYWLDLYADERLARLTFGGQTVQIDGVYYDLDRPVETELDDLFATLGAAAAATTPPSLTDTADLETFLDDFFAAHLDAYRIPGAVVAVVVNGRLHLAKGYGYADLADQRPVTPTTVFDVGSVSKLFTYTAVMQLVEQGRLDLHADINHYLTRFQIPDTFPQPVTAAHLLTHTGGFDEWDIGAATRRQDEVLPVCDYLAQRLPPRIRPPGELLVYANHGTALAGCLVEEISGQPFADYVARHILAPLGMDQSSFGWPPELMDQIATGYELRPDGPHPYPIYYRHYGPAGELKTTAVDISRVMIAHLQDGRFEDTQILQPATAALMHRQQYSHDPRLPGFTYGFFEDELNGRRAILHGGDTTPTFSSLLLLLPEENVGLFIAHNTVEWHFRQQLVEAFMDRYFPATAPPDPIQALAEPQLEQYAGYYLPSLVQRSSNIEKVIGLLAQFRLTAEADGTLTLHPGAGFAQSSRWVAIAPDHLRQLDGDGVMVFQREENGRIQHMFYSDMAAVAFTRLAWYQTTPFHLGLLLITLLVFVTAVAAWLLRYRRQQTAGREAALAGLIGLLNLLFVAGLFWVLQTRSFDLIFGPTPLIYLISAVPLLTLCLTLILLLLTLLRWRQQKGGLLMRLHHSLLLLAAAAFYWFLDYWMLLGFNY